MKEMAIAYSQGQRVYMINPDNRDAALPKIGLSGDAGLATGLPMISPVCDW